MSLGSETVGQTPTNGEFRDDGYRYDGTSWRRYGKNHHMNSDGLIFYKRKYRSLTGYLQQGGKLTSIVWNKNTPVAKAISEYTKDAFDTVQMGYVYLIVNPAFDGWVKCGKAVDVDNRLESYQTSSPYRNYKEVYRVFTHNRHGTEVSALDALSSVCEDRHGEWFKVDTKEAVAVLEKLL